MNDRPNLKTRVLMNDNAERLGFTLPKGHEHDRPVVQWRRRGCRDRLLRVFLSPAGWHLLTEGFRVTPQEWLRRVGATDDHGQPVEVAGVPATMTAHAAGDLHFLHLREVDGLYRLLPLPVDEWEPARFEVGCDHEQYEVALADVADDCRRARRDRHRVTRELRPNGVA